MTQVDNNKSSKGFINKFLDGVEWLGNKLPDPAILFFFGMIIVALLSWWLSGIDFGYIDPRTHQTAVINNLLTGQTISAFLSNAVQTFAHFHPLGVVLVAMLGVGVAEESGFINTGLKKLLNITPKKLLTPMLIFVGMLSHVGADAGYVLVIPIGGVLFYAAGRNPLVGIAAAFSGVSGGFAANLVPAANDALLQSITQAAARIVDPSYDVNVLCNWFFGIGSTFFLIIVGWFVTDKIVEPRLNKIKLDDGVEDNAADLRNYSKQENKAFWTATLVMALCLAAFAFWAAPADSALREAGTGSLTNARAPLMASIVSIIFIVFVIPGIVYGWMVKSFTSGKDIIAAMSNTMGKMSGYIVMMFFCALFLYMFANSNMGTIIALAGADFLKSMNISYELTIVLAILFIAFINLFVGSASAKWALISPVIVPMLMHAGISPELTQAAYRVGDSTTNIISPLMVYFPLVVVYCQRYVKNTGVGTVISMMMPYTIFFLVMWIIFLLAWWGLGLPLGIDAPYTYTLPN